MVTPFIQINKILLFLILIGGIVKGVMPYRLYDDYNFNDIYIIIFYLMINI
jgi:hypothetical protein